MIELRDREKEASKNALTPYEQYRRLSGEVEARNVQSRQHFTAEERRNRSPESTEDVARAEQIVRFNNGRSDFALREDPSSEFAKAVPKRQANSYDEARSIVTELLGEPLTNRETGMIATISKRSMDKLVSGKAVDKSSNLHDHLTAVANIDQLFENATLGWIEDHKNNDPNIVGVHRLFAPLNVDGVMRLVKLTIKEMAFNQGNRIYSVETIEVEDGDLSLSWKPELREKTKNTSQQIANVQSLIQRIKDFNSSDENSDDIRYSVKQSAMEQAKSGKSIPRETLLDQVLSMDKETYKALFQKGKSKVAEQLADSKMPVIDFINQWKNVKAADKQRIKPANSFILRKIAS